ncbi:hypothetical protein ABBQ32_003407 [Trebouxia sp. C0010 RCD-2024]
MVSQKGNASTGVGPDRYRAALAAAEAVPKQLFINNKFVDAKSGKKIPVVDPRSEKTIFEIDEGCPEDVDAAILAASEAFVKGPWPRTAAVERGRMLDKLADLVEQHAEEFALLETLDTGKPFQAALMMDIPGFVAHMRHQAGWADKLSGQTLKHSMPVFAYTLREPYGNTVVAKPAEQTMLSTLRLAQLVVEAGFPPGVFNVVTGYGKTVGAALVKHPLVHKIGFTGSTAVGKEILAEAAGTMKSASLECGGKNPLIICADANIDEAVGALQFAAFTNAGQFCTSASRLFVHADIYDAFMAKAIKRTQARKVGDPFEDGTEQGAITFRSQFDKVMHLIQSGQDQGATLLTGGKRKGDEGFFIEPTLFGDVKDDMRIATEEVFGPVLCCMKWHSVDEVIARANATRYGLVAGVFTNNVNLAHTMSRSLEAATVWINNCWHCLSPSVPFGSYKESGTGVEGGQQGIEAYTKCKVVMTPLSASPWV